jgi:hypothetical protein
MASQNGYASGSSRQSAAAEVQSMRMQQAAQAEARAEARRELERAQLQSVPEPPRSDPPRSGAKPPSGRLAPRARAPPVPEYYEEESAPSAFQFTLPPPPPEHGLCLAPSSKRAQSGWLSLAARLSLSLHESELHLTTARALSAALRSCSTVSALLLLAGLALFLGGPALVPGGQRRVALGCLAGASALLNLLSLLLAAALSSLVGHLGAGPQDAAETALHAFVRSNPLAFAAPLHAQRLSVLLLAAALLVVASSLYGVPVAVGGAALFGFALFWIGSMSLAMLELHWNHDLYVLGTADEESGAASAPPPPPPPPLSPTEFALKRMADMMDPFRMHDQGPAAAPAHHARTDLVNHGLERMKAAQRDEERGRAAQPPPTLQQLLPSAPPPPPQQQQQQQQKQQQQQRRGPPPPGEAVRRAPPPGEAQAQRRPPPPEPQLSATPSVQELMAAKKRQEQLDMASPPPVAPSGRPLSVQEMLAQKRAAEGLYVPGSSGGGGLW